MKDYKDKYNNLYSKIKMDTNTENMILNNTIKRKTLTPVFKKVVITVSMAILISIISIGIVYAQEIKDFITNWYASVRLEDCSEIKITENILFKKIPDNAPIVDDISKYIEMTHSELEDVLGFKILNYNDISTDLMYYRTWLNKDGNIGRVDVWWPKFIFESENKFVTMSIGILNVNADRKFIEAFKEGYDASGNIKFEKEYYSQNLDTHIVMYSTIREYNSKYISVQFVYDDVLYHISGKNISTEQMEEIIEKLF